MLKFALMLLSDWNAYVRAIGRNEPGYLLRRWSSLGAVSVWPLDPWPALAARC